MAKSRTSASTPEVASTAPVRSSSRRRLIAFSGVGIVVVLLVGYLIFAEMLLNVNGTWYGTGTFAGGPSGTTHVAVYLDLHQSLTGAVTGTAMFCTSDFGQPATTPLTVYGSTPVFSVQFKLLVGDNPNPSTRGIAFSGLVQNGRFAASDTSSSTTFSLDVQHGAQSDFMTKCRALA